MISKLAAKKGKVDRAKEQELKKLERGRTYLTPKNVIEQSVLEIYKDFKSKFATNDRDVDDGINIYLNARNLRHDIWLELLNQSCCLRGVVFGDIRYSEFIKRIKPDHKFNSLVNYNKTPDILLMAHHEYVLLGDVTVTKTVNASGRRKYFKYLDLENDMISNGLKVRHLDLIIDETLGNYRSELQKFIDLEIINPNMDIVKRAMEYHKTCQIIMDQMIKQVSSPLLFTQRLDQIDRIEFEGADIKVDNRILEDNPLLECMPKLSEKKLIEMIKNKTEENLDFFDIDKSEINNSFEKLINANRDREHTEPKSILKIVSNQYSIENCTNHNLILDYVKDIGYGDDDDIKDYLLDFLPTSTQLKYMKKIYEDKDKSRKSDSESKKNSVYGPYQYKRTRNNSHKISSKINEQLNLGKKFKNTKYAPKSINPEIFSDCVRVVNDQITYFGSKSTKKSFLDDTWDARTNFEMESSKEEKDIYEYVKSTNGAQLGHSLSNLYHRLMHLKTNLGSKDNIYVPPNSSFICIIPNEHAPINSSRCDLPMIFITRISKNERHDVINILQNGIEYEYKLKTPDFTYYVSKLCRLSLDKISHWDQIGYKIVSTNSYLLSTCTDLKPIKEKVVGLLTILSIDGHQKTSEYLDLLKYIAFMPFSDISRLPVLISDKCDLLVKTCLDVWLLLNMQNFITELSKIELLNAVKPKLQLFNSNVTRDSLGLSINLPSFISNTIRHCTVENFIEEVSMIYIVRPKHLYGSQFMDKSLCNTIDWTIEYSKEVEEHKGWATEGYDDTTYPFDAKFCFSRDAIFYAQRHLENKICPDVRKIHRELNNTSLTSYMHYNCSLRGCVKENKTRKNINDLHTTSMDECLKYYRRKNYNDESCTAMAIATEFLKTQDVMEFSMSEKDQRGGGRPIATPTLHAKATLMMIEKPEQAIGAYIANNIIVSGKHKLKEQSDCYKKLLSTGAVKGFKQVYQLTEDQSKFSENDNYRKYYWYISNNNLLPPNVRSLQLACIKKLENREHLVKRMPKSILEDPVRRLFMNRTQNGVVTNIGWPQGMCNMISTSIHSIADYWITNAYNIAYPNDKVETLGLVHSDDSWVTVACNSLESFKRFTIFRTYAKRLFCLKLNDKKVWGSKYLGELVSNYNINGNVHLSVAKTLANSFGNMIYQNWTMDVHIQVSSIQQAYRNGATLPTLIMLSTILRQQMLDCYHVTGYHLENLYNLPIELGGYPDSSAFELGVTGIVSHYKKILTNVRTLPDDPVTIIILKALRLSIMYTLDKEKLTSNIDKAYRDKTNLTSKFPENVEMKDVDFQSVTVPSKGEIFSCIRHILPKSKKVSKTIDEINILPFSSDGLEMIITKPNKLSDALGHLKSQTSTMLYQLAAEKYTQSARRLAISQAIQSSGKVVRVCNFPPMTINEMLYFVHRSPVQLLLPDMLEVALNDETDISTICEACVYRSEYEAYSIDKRKVINRMPDTDDKFKTICKLRNVLLFTIDKLTHSKFFEEYATKDEPISVLTQDSDLIRRRFHVYFQYYTASYACNLIMQQYITRLKSKLWMQPFLSTDSIQSFISDLYGKTINKNNNYRLSININSDRSNKRDIDIINSIYAVSVLNTMYTNKFKIESILEKGLVEIIDSIDYANLDNNSYLKYGVIKKYHQGSNEHLEEYDNRKMYDQTFIKPQKFINGKWVGKFICKARFGNTVVQIEGEPEDVTITVNRINISDILNCMHIFIKQNFKYYSYPHPNNWNSSSFWNTSFKVSQLFLTSYNSVVTMVTQKATLCSVSLVLNRYLKMPVTYNDLTYDDYILDENNRVVLKKIGDATIKVASVSQSLTCPFASSIKCEPNLLEGYDNNELLNSKVIFNITLKKYFSCNRSEITKLINGRVPPLDSTPLVNFYTNLLSSFGDLQYIPERTIDDVEVELTSYDIAGITSMNFLEKHLETTPEDLSYIETDFVYDDEIRTGSIFMHTSITRLLCSILTNHYTDADVYSIIHLLFKNNDFIQSIITDLDSSKEDLDEKIDTARSAADIMEVSRNVICFIIGNRLDDYNFISNLDIGEIIKKDNTLHSNLSINMYTSVLNEIMFNIHEIDLSNNERRSKLLSLLRS